MKKNFDFLPKYTKKDVSSAKKDVLSIDPSDYGGHLCEVEHIPSEQMTLMTAKCENGTINLM